MICDAGIPNIQINLTDTNNSGKITYDGTNIYNNYKKNIIRAKELF